MEANLTADCRLVMLRFLRPFDRVALAEIAIQRVRVRCFLRNLIGMRLASITTRPPMVRLKPAFLFAAGDES
jgi:hypothetical protein